jgi:hypothetical protein
MAGFGGKPTSNGLTPAAQDPPINILNWPAHTLEKAPERVAVCHMLHTHQKTVASALSLD